MDNVPHAEREIKKILEEPHYSMAKMDFKKYTSFMFEDTNVVSYGVTPKLRMVCC